MIATPDLTAAYYHWIEATKIDVADKVGLDVSADRLHPSLFPHQRDIVLWAAHRGRGLIAASFGLGKTRVECDLMRLVHENTGKKTLVVCPLGVRHQFTEEDGPAMGMHFQYVRTDAEALAADTPYLITNYERVRDSDISAAFIAAHIGGCTLDEGNVLRSLGSDTQLAFTAVMQPVPFRWVATATPSPNSYRELIYYAEYLDVMDHGQALTRWFKRDSQKAGNLTIHPHHEKEFWLWIASWAIFVTTPSDLGYSDEGYDMPELQVFWHKVTSHHEKAWDITDSWGQRHLFMDSASSITASMKEKRNSLEDRIDYAVNLIKQDNPRKHWIIWHHLEDERRYIRKSLPEAIEVYGSQPLEEREQRILDFTHGNYRVLATKPIIAGSGCNFQYHCHACIFTGIRYQFDEFIQAIHRLQRFQQKHPVEVHIIFTDAEDSVVQTLKRKWQQHKELTHRMKNIIKEYGLGTEALKMDLQRSIGSARQEVVSGAFTAVCNDSVVEWQRLEDDSLDLIHTSIPFGNHYEYSASYNDFGHNPSDADFWSQMDYLTPNLLRTLKPGRIAAIHVKDRLLYGHQNGLGVMSVAPFSDQCVAHFLKHGFIYFGRITIVTDVVRENNSTYRLGWTENSKDSSKMGVGMPEYLLLFRKMQSDNSRSYADTPVTKDKATYTRARWQIDAAAFWRSSGDRLVRPDEVPDLDAERFVGMETADIYRWFQAYSRSHVYDYSQHVGMGEPLEEAGRLPATFMLFPPQAPAGPAQERVWTDVVYMETLNSDQSMKRQENHVCPLPFDIVDRTITRYSNPGEIVADPFAGLFTVPYRAVKLGRRGYGCELSPDYWRWGVHYCREAEAERNAPSLFDLLPFTVEEPTNDMFADVAVAAAQ